MSHEYKVLEKMGEICSDKRGEGKAWNEKYLLELIINSFPDGIVILNSKGKVCFCNLSAEEILGYKLDEIRGLDFHTLFISDADLIDKVKKGFSSFEATGNGPMLNKNLQFRLKTKMGSLIYIEVFIKALRFKDEWIALGIIRNATNFVNLKDKMTRHRVKFQTLFKSANDAIFILNKEGIFIDANPKTMEMFGCEKAQIIGKSPYDFSPEFQPDGSSSKEKAIEKIKETLKGIPQYFEWVHNRYDDSRPIYVEVGLSCMELSGEPTILAIVRDVSEKKELEKKLRERDKLILLLTETAPVGIIKCDFNGNIEYVNPKAKEILIDMGINILNGLNIRNPVFKEYGIWSVFEKCVEYNVSDSKEIKLHSDSGVKKWYSVIFDHIIHKGEKLGIRGVFLDITKDKELEFIREREQKRIKMFLQGMPHPVWFIDRNRRIVAQNKAAQNMGSKIGDYCWRSVLSMRCIPKEARDLIDRIGVILPGTKCDFCQADKALERQISVEMEVEVGNNHFNAFWIPVEEDMFLHYLVDITRYKELERDLRCLSTTDPLTGIYNRRYWVEKCEEEISRAQRYYKPFSVIMLDIDDFKKVNDEYGHNIGDEVLKAVSRVLVNRSRKTDISARWGGEEFVVLLPGTKLDHAVILAEDIRKLIEEMSILGFLKITASFGVTEYKKGDTPYKLVDRADKMLYKAKKQGKNCVCYEKERH